MGVIQLVFCSCVVCCVLIVSFIICEDVAGYGTDTLVLFDGYVADMLQVCAVYQLWIGNARTRPRLRVDLRLLLVCTVWLSHGPGSVNKSVFMSTLWLLKGL